MGYFDDLFSLKFTTQCDWLPANQFLFQLANLFLVLTYFVQPNSLAGLMQLRFALLMAGLCFGLWGGIVICSLDCMLWNLCFTIGNALHLIYLIINTRPIKFSRNHELIYGSMFQPVGVKRFQYGKLTSLAMERYLNPGDYYAKEGVSECDHIAIISSGRIGVELKNCIVSHIDELEFVDSPEWIATDDATPITYQVSLIAKSTCILYVWKRSDLTKVFKKDNMMKNVFDSLIGKDICKKLFSLHQNFLTPHDHYNTTISNTLHQASLLTYSAANLMEIHRRSTDMTPYTSPRQHVEPVSNNNNFNGNAICLPIENKNENYDVTNNSDHKYDITHNYSIKEPSLYDDIEINYSDIENENLLLRETNL